MEPLDAEVGPPTITHSLTAHSITLVCTHACEGVWNKKVFRAVEGEPKERESLLVAVVDSSLEISVWRWIFAVPLFFLFFFVFPALFLFPTKICSF